MHNRLDIVRTALAALICLFALPSGVPPAAPLMARANAGEPPAAQDAGRSAAATPDVDPTRRLRPADLKALGWRSIGPANMGGRVAAVAFAPSDVRTFYVGFATGGLWKTTNRGTTFAPLFDKEATSSMGSVVVCDAPADWPGWEAESAKSDAPTSAAAAERTAVSAPASSAPASKPAADRERVEAGKGKIVWVGTGEGNGRNSSSWGAGVYRSTDGGGSFACVGLTNSHDIPALAVDPRNPDVCYVAALGHLWGPNEERGVYKTSDGGKTWSRVLSIDDQTGACDVRIDPRTPDTIYAAMYSRLRTAWSFRSGGPEGGIYRSRDAGKTWTKLTDGLPKQTGRIGLDLFQSNPRILMAIVESDEGGSGVDVFDDRQRSGGLFRSSDGGDTWKRVCDLNPRPFYFSKVRIDPKDAQRVYVLGWGMMVSDDGGRNFRPSGARVPHGDLHALEINPRDTDHLLLGTDGGVYASYDRGATWDFFNHIPAGQFYNVACDLSEPYRVGGGLQDNGTWIGPSATILSSGDGDPAGNAGITNADWRLIGWGDGFHMAFDPLDNSIVYAESQGGYLARIHLDTGRRRSIKPAPKEGQPRFRFNWNSPFFISSHDATTLYFAGNYVFKLTQRGDRWQRISEDLSARDVNKIETVGSEAETHGTVVALAESPVLAGTLWAGTDDGRVHVTVDDGQTWTEVTPPQCEGRYVARIEASHHEHQTAYVAIDGHRSNRFEPVLVMTRDRGASWSLIIGPRRPTDDAPPAGLPDGDVVKVVREDIRNPDVLYAGMERGAYLSIDRGASWVRLNNESLPTVAVDDLAQQPCELDLIAGTHGRSIYILDDASPLGQLTPAVVQSAFHLFTPQAARPWFYMDYAGLWSQRIFRAANPPNGAAITYWVRDYNDEGVSISIADAKGRAVRSLGGGNRPGLNRVVWDLKPEPHDTVSTPDGWSSPFVPAGEYTVTVSFGERSEKTTLTVLSAPGEPK